MLLFRSRPLATRNEFVYKTRTGSFPPPWSYSPLRRKKEWLVMTVEWICKNEKCKFKKGKTPCTKTLQNHEPAPACGCKTTMVRVVPLPTFDSLAAEVAKALAKEYAASY